MNMELAVVVAAWRRACVRSGVAAAIFDPIVRPIFTEF